jgi:ABC-2 type transport system permease protein
MLVVAAREYLAAVRTKTFLIGLLVMPLLMGGSVLIQVIFKDVVDTAERTYALIDRTPGRQYTRAIEDAVSDYNAKAVENGKQVRPRFVVETVAPQGTTDQEIKRQRYELSERVRTGKLHGFAEVLPGAGGDSAEKEKPEGRVTLRYQSNRVTDMAFAKLAEDAVAKKVRADVRKETGLAKSAEKVLLHPVKLLSKGLTELDKQTGEATEASEQSRIASVLAPGALMMLMFMVVLMGATPLMQGVVEEKMQRIAEVLLGSVRPFPLMMGKLIGMAGVSLTISAVYMAGGFWAAAQFGFGGALSAETVAWFVVYQVMAALMYGSLFIAVGAACTDMKETQNMLWPVMLLVMLPVFLLGNVLREPNGPLAVGLSFFPFSTPMLMVARLAAPPGIPWWQPALGVVVVLLTTVLCVYAAGRIFRVGLLMQGKGARFGEMVKWVFRG